jgi:hypothetical protein
MKEEEQYPSWIESAQPVTKSLTAKKLDTD